MQITLPHFWAPLEPLHADRANFAAIGSLKLCFGYDSLDVFVANHKNYTLARVFSDFGENLRFVTAL